MNDKFKKQLKEAILELLISRLDEQDPKAAPKVDPVVQRPKSTYNAPKTIKPAPSMPRSVGTQAAKSGIGKLLGRGASKLIPGIGVALGAYDVYDIISQPDPNPPRGYGDTPRARRYGNYIDKLKIQPQTRPEPTPSPEVKKSDTVKASPTSKSTIAPAAVGAAAAAATLSKAASKASTKSSKKTSRQVRKPPTPDIDDSSTEEIKEPSKFRGVRKRTIGTSPKTDPTERINRTRYK